VTTSVIEAELFPYKVTTFAGLLESVTGGRIQVNAGPDHNRHSCVCFFVYDYFERCIEKNLLCSDAHIDAVISPGQNTETSLNLHDKPPAVRALKIRKIQNYDFFLGII
jgi:hypothetical protein